MLVHHNTETISYLNILLSVFYIRNVGIKRWKNTIRIGGFPLLFWVLLPTEFWCWTVWGWYLPHLNNREITIDYQAFGSCPYFEIRFTLLSLWLAEGLASLGLFILSYCNVHSNSVKLTGELWYYNMGSTDFGTNF